MKIIEIKTLDNGAHRNQTCDFIQIAEGWAVIPDDMETPNFPFGKVDVKEINGVMTVTRWTAGTIPEIEEPEQPITEIERLRADIDFLAVMTGVEL